MCIGIFLKNYIFIFFYLQSDHVKFYGGNTLYTKILYYWQEVPPSEYESLKMRILQQIPIFAEDRYTIVGLLKAVSVQF